MKTPETSQNSPQPEQREDQKFPLSPDGFILSDGEADSRDNEIWRKLQKKEMEAREDPSYEVSRLLGLIGTYTGSAHEEGGIFLDKAGAYQLCDEILKKFTEDETGQSVLQQELVKKCQPLQPGELQPENPIKLLSGLKSYVYFLLDEQKFQEANVLLKAIKFITASNESSYILAKRAENIINDASRWKGKSEFGKNLEVFERYGDRTLIPIAPGMYGHYDKTGDIYIPGDTTHPQLLNHKLSVNDLSLFPDNDKDKPDNTINAYNVLDDYRFLRDPEVFRTLPQNVRQNLISISLPEQAQVVQFMERQSVEKYGVFEKFVEKYGTTGTRAFLSLETDYEMGKKILSIGENLQNKGAEKIFTKYTELVDASQNTKDFLCASFGCNEEENAKMTWEIGRNLLRRGRDLLAEFADEIEAAKKEERGLPNEEKITRKLDLMKTDIILFGESMKVMRKEHPEMDIAELVAVEIVSEKPQDVAERKEEVAEMKAIYQENYADMPEEFKEYLLQSFDKKLGAQSGRFYTVRHNGKLIAFASFTDDNNGNIYFGAFNANPHIKGSSLGGYLLEEALAYESALAEKRGAKIEAHAIPGSAVFRRYTEKDGFIASGPVEMVHGVPLVHIERSNIRREAEKHTSEKSE